MLNDKQKLVANILARDSLIGSSLWVVHDQPLSVFFRPDGYSGYSGSFILESVHQISVVRSRVLIDSIRLNPFD